MQTLDLDLSKRYTFADYLTWVDDKRRELIDGFVKMMSPAPSTAHQQILFNISFNFGKLLLDSPYKIFFAPFDVRLPENVNDTSNEKVFTVVQPDISIICDLAKIDAKGCIGAPDLIAEITSPTSMKRDIEEKFRIYEKHGVREYWVLFPETKSVNIFVLNEQGKYQISGMFASESKVKVHIFEGLEIDLKDIFKM